MRISEQKISEKLLFPVSVHVYDSIDSTNNEAKLHAGESVKAELYASMHQTEGRGRRGHSFCSPRGSGLYMSLSLPVRGSAENVQLMTCAAAAAACKAIIKLSDKRPQIKWVNDIFVDGKKTAGILTELACDEKNQPIAVIIGIGLNLSTKGFPTELAENSGCLGDIDPNLLCAEITNLLCEYYEALPQRRFLELYKTLSLCIGCGVSFTKDGKEHTARAVDIAPDGGLIVEENGARFTLNSGEISVLPL